MWRIGIAALLVICAGCSSDEVGGEQESGSEHAVIVHLAGALPTEAVFALEDRLIAAIEEADAGELDGNEIALDGSEVILYAYGPDADALFEAMGPVLAEIRPPPGSYALKRYRTADDQQAREVRVEL